MLSFDPRPTFFSRATGSSVAHGRWKWLALARPALARGALALSALAWLAGVVCSATIVQTALAQEPSAQESAVQETSAHELSTQESSAHESMTQESVAQASTAQESAAQQSAAQGSSLQESTAQEFSTQEGPTQEAAAQETALPESGPEMEAYVTRLEAQLTLRDRLDHGEYEEAVPIARRLVALTAQEYGERSIETAVATSNLAESERRARLYEDAERSFLASIELFQELRGEFSEEVVTPLIGLGVTYQSMDLHPEAVAALQQARTVSRRISGLLSERQVEILDHIANSMVSMDLYEEADEQRLASLRIMERIHGENSLEILPSLYRHALWLRNGYQFTQERDYYGRAMSIIRSVEGGDSPLLAQPLRQTGNSFRIQKLPEGRGVSSLRRALEILDTQPEPDKLQIARVLRDIGDWNVAFSKIGPTGEEYQRAWNLLDEVENGQELQRRWFFEPDYVLQEHPSTRGLAEAGEPGARPGHVLVTFDVLPSGRTQNIRVVESVPPGLKDTTSARSIARSRFRPKMVAGEFVVAEDVARDFTFFYTPRDPD